MTDADIYRQFTWPVRVYWEDTDAGGVVYHTGYLRFMERARSEWLRAVGVEQAKLREQYDLVFVLRSAEIDFRRAARLDDLLDVRCTVAERKRASLSFRQEICDSAGVLVSGIVRVACVSASGFRPQVIPDGLLPLMCFPE